MSVREHCGVRAGCVFVLLVLLVHGCAGYVPGRQTYWDAQVREMCAKDGGVQIFEKIRITVEDAKFLGKADGRIGIPAKDRADPRAPVYAVNRTSVIREGVPGVWRSEWDVVRRTDGAVIAKAIIYNRSGGDFPSPAHDSRYMCPDLKRISAELQQVFVVEGDER